MPFGQLVVGPPGSGKTTYCNGMQQFLSLMGRKTVIVNLDPANDSLPYECSVDIAALVSLEEVQNSIKLGPNGGMVYCMDYLASNLDWLQEKLEALQAGKLHGDTYILFDCPGQVELFTLHDNLKGIITTLTDKWHYRLAAVHLVDAHLCSNPAKYLSALLLSLSVMLHLELPHVNVLSKIDLIEQYGQLDFNLDFYTEVQDLSHLVQAMDEDVFGKRFCKLSQGLAEVVGDYGLLSFQPLAIEDKDSVQKVLALIDKANGHAFSALSRSQNPYPAGVAYALGVSDPHEDDASHQDKYMTGEVTERRPG
eukprot:jgi/Astpho2/2985/e_gw1.00051.152.1_t